MKTRALLQFNPELLEYLP